MFNLDANLYIDVDAPGGLPCLLSGKNSSGITTAPTYIFADCFPLNLYFRTRNGVGTASTAVGLASLNIVVGAKLLSNLSATSLLFSASDFVAVGTDDDLHYQAVLDLDKTELATALGSNKNITARVNVEVENADNSRRLTYQFDVVIQAQAYGGESSPTPGTPIYPVPSLLVTKIRGTVALTEGDTVIAITGLNLPSVPAQILPSIRKPTAGADNVQIGGVADDSLSVDGFSVALAAAVPASGYKLDYLVIL